MESVGSNSPESKRRGKGGPLRSEMVLALEITVALRERRRQ